MVDRSSLFLILGRSRTGSNMMVRLLNQHPDIACEGEIFRRVDAREWPLTLGEMSRRPVAWTGFKMFYYHGVGDDGALWDRLVATEEMPVLHLRRRNILRTATSRKLAMSSDQWISVKEAPRGGERRVSFTPEELSRDFEQTRRYESQFAERFSTHPTVDAEYEELAADPFAVCAEVAEMLGLPPLPADSEVKTRKQNPEPLPELIENYEELAEHFAATRWAEFFSE
jgi:LPS sulfotransferase NodH